MDHREMMPEEIADNPFKLIGADWMLITAGRSEAFNTMTASWGGLGVLWERKVCFIFVRPTATPTGSSSAPACSPCPSSTSSTVRRSGSAAPAPGGTRTRCRDRLTPAGEGDTVWFREARLVLACRKLYVQDLGPERFLDRRSRTCIRRRTTTACTSGDHAMPGEGVSHADRD